MINWLKFFFLPRKTLNNLRTITLKSETNDAASYRHLESIEYKRQGDVQFEIENFAAAADCYRQSIKADPDFAKAYCDLGRALIEQGLGRDAEPFISCAIKEKAKRTYRIGTRRGKILRYLSYK